MKGIQKVIKYCAMAFAIFLSVTIFASIAAALLAVVAGTAEISIGGITYGEKERVELFESYTKEEIEELGIERILIDCPAEIVIKQGAELSVHAENVTEEYELRCKDGKLSLKSSESEVFRWVFHIFDGGVREEKVTLTVPEGYVPKQVEVNSGSGSATVTDLTVSELRINSGSGAVSLQGIHAEQCSIDSGSGRVYGKELYAQSTGIDSGSGRIFIESAELGKLRLNSGSGAVELTGVTAENAEVESGSGSITLTGKLTGVCDFDSGSGKVTLHLDGREADYRIVADCGSGAFRVNGRKLQDGSYGSNVCGELRFDSGSGAVTVEFSEN